VDVQELIQQEVALYSLEHRQSRSFAVVSSPWVQNLIATFHGESRLHECYDLARHICQLFGTHTSAQYFRHFIIRGDINHYFLQLAPR
jgi:hypothetical protein